jgi:hypothetical protein
VWLVVLPRCCDLGSKKKQLLFEKD